MIKKITTNKYQIRFNTKTGYEEMEGINGNLDPFILEYPSLIDVGIMGNCQNRCEFCYQGDGQQDHMLLDDFKKMIDEVKDHVNQCALGGRGNPNKHSNFKEIIEYSIANNVVPNYTTSGLDLTEDEVTISKDCGSVAVSMHYKDYTWRALKMFMDAGIMTNIHFIISDYSIDEAINLLKENDPWNGNVDLDKLNAVIFLLFKKQGRGKLLNNWVPNIEKLKIFGDKLQNFGNWNRKYNYMIGADSCMFNKLNNLKTQFTKEQLQCIDTCEGGRMSCYISPDMNLIPCSFGGNFNGESIKNKSFKEVWDNSQEFLRFRKELGNDPSECPYHLI